MSERTKVSAATIVYQLMQTDVQKVDMNNIISVLVTFTCIADYAVAQEDTVIERNERCPDEGYYGSQEKTKSNLVALDSSGDNSLLENYFTETPSLNNCSFHIMWSQASAYPDEGQNLPFKDL